ncbi:hypothetical protein RIF29_26453 [Crotalaria pallida]|uniref:Uncharacterized protein n=1 Tax=Crotalaria pallida TaxID=3830 RepID=A0AAN9HZV7_CROPI
MARNKGHPPKSPSSHQSPPPNTIPKNVDLENLDEEDIEDIDDLSPKKAASILKKLDALRAKIKGKAVLEAEVEGINNEELIHKTPTRQADLITNEEQPRRTSIWDSFDITKLRNAGEKLNFVEPEIKEGVPEENMEAATQAVKEVLQAQCEEGEMVSVVKETQLEGDDKGLEVQNLKDQKEGQWTLVLTRRKAQEHL